MVRDGICVSCSFSVVFYPILATIPNFIQIGRKTQKLKIFAIGRFWLVGLVGRKMVVGISNSFYVVFGPLIALIPNFIQIGQKTQIKNFRYCLVLVGRAGRTKNGCRYFKLILCCFWAINSRAMSVGPMSHIALQRLPWYC